MMTNQEWINIILLVISGLGSIVLTLTVFILARMWKQLDSITKGMSDLSILVAGQYLTRAEHDMVMREIFTKLDRLMERQHDPK